MIMWQIKTLVIRSPIPKWLWRNNVSKPIILTVQWKFVFVYLTHMGCRRDWWWWRLVLLRSHPTRLSETQEYLAIELPTLGPALLLFSADWSQIVCTPVWPRRTWTFCWSARIPVSEKQNHNRLSLRVVPSSVLRPCSLGMLKSFM